MRLLIKKPSRLGLVVFFFLIILFSLLILSNSLSHFRSILSDNLHGGKKPLENIIIVKIDDYSIEKIGKWPWDRSIFAELLKKTEDAKIIGLDLSLFEPSSNDKSLIKALKEMNNVVLASELTEEGLNAPIFNLPHHGYVNLNADSDGVIRSIEKYDVDYLPFSFAIYKFGWNERALFENKKFFINFISKPESFSFINAYDLLDSNPNFKDKIVLIGVTAPNLHDAYFVPTSNGVAMSGVEIHANILQNLILDNFVEKQSRISILLFVFFAGIFGMFLLSQIRINYTIPIVLILLLAYILNSIIIFSRFNYLLDLFFFPIALLSFTGAGIGVNYLEEKKQNLHIVNAFGKYVNKDLLKEILSRKRELRLWGEKKNITVFFSDIRGFTTLSEKINPEDLVSLMNYYLTEMTKIILKNKGTVDKFIGDAIMAFWNAPIEEKDHSYLACKTAVEQIQILERINKELSRKNLPSIKIGIGINTGEAIIGNMGSEERFDYTAIGDNVNIASRLEGLTKQYKSNIIISESTYNAVKNRLKCKKIGLVNVKGKKLPVNIYELIVR
ncbi:adenylate/guanylate cyclase domain-containing protein [Candidatus Pacearchaeota archaeon]|nr:adenylate/guanylate cyclase domain-containing protein [Candidatus Pacearchaeota archaeon]